MRLCSKSLPIEMSKVEGVPFHGTPPNSKGAAYPSGGMFSKAEKFVELAGMTYGAGRGLYDAYRIGGPIARGAQGLAGRAFDTMYSDMDHHIVAAEEYDAALTAIRMGLVF